MKTQPWIVILFVMGLLAACGSRQEPLPDNLSFKPIADVIEGELRIGNFTNGTASLPITSIIPLACSIVYGTSPEFGSIATDLDMAGGAHSEHNPLLTGLTSDTQYYYRVQGVDAAGNIYVSEVLTFTTSNFEALSSNLDNLALASNGTMIIGYSSIFGDGDADSQWGVNNAIDGNPNTQWSSNGDGNEAWIEFELATETHVQQIGFWTRTMGTSAQIESFQIITDSDEILGPFTLSDASDVFYFEVDFVARRLHFEVLTSSGGNTGAIEIEIYGETQ